VGDGDGTVALSASAPLGRPRTTNPTTTVGQPSAIPAGCHQNTFQNLPNLNDVYYDGTSAVVGNLALKMSVDGTCAGGSLATTLALIDSETEAAADTECQALVGALLH
jgi:hypothetical protein